MVSPKNNLQSKKEIIFDVRHLTKKYGSLFANREIDLKIYKGENIGIVGPNGGGKTTFVELLCGVKEITSGKIVSSLGSKTSEIAEHLGVQFQDSKYPDGVTVNDMINFYLDIYNERFQKKTRDYFKKLKIQKIDFKKKRPKKITDIKILHQKNLIILNNKLRKITDVKKRTTVLNQIKDLEKKTKKEIKIVSTFPKNRMHLQNKELKKQRKEKKSVLKIKFLNDRKKMIEKLLKINSGSDTVKNKKQKSRNDSGKNDFSIIKKRKEVRFQIREHRKDYFYQKRTIGITIRQQKVNEFIKIFKLQKLEKKDIKKLSGGQQQRLNVLLSIIHNPEVIILDEISTGLDVQSRSEIKEFIKKIVLKNQRTLILISHNMDEIEELCNRVIYFSKGQIVEDWQISTLIQKYGNLNKWIFKAFIKYEKDLF